MSHDFPNDFLSRSVHSEGEVYAMLTVFLLLSAGYSNSSSWKNLIKTLRHKNDCNATCFEFPAFV